MLIVFAVVSLENDKRLEESRNQLANQRDQLKLKASNASSSSNNNKKVTQLIGYILFLF